MLLPDNIHPERSVYFNGAFVLQTLQESGSMRFLDLYEQTNKRQPMSMHIFILCLDWLFLLSVVTLKREKVELCS